MKDAYYDRDLIIVNPENYSNYQNFFRPTKISVDAVALSGPWQDGTGLLYIDKKYTYWMHPKKDIFDSFPICGILYIDNSLSLTDIITTGIFPYLDAFSTIRCFGEGNLYNELIDKINAIGCVNPISPEEVRKLCDTQV